MLSLVSSVVLLAWVVHAAGTTINVTVTSTSTVYTSTVTASIAVTPPVTITNTVFGSTCSLNPPVTVTTVVPVTAVLTTTVLYTPTSTITVTAVPTCPAPDITCGNAGLQWAYTKGNVSETCSVKNSVYCANYEPAAYKAKTPIYNDTVQAVGGFGTSNSQSNYTFYGYSWPARYFILNHRGYFFAPQTGKYTFKFELCDDKCWLWLGSDAYSGWNKSNADDYVVYTNLKTGTYNTTLTQGTYTPLRVYHTQGFGPVNLTFTVTGPDGTVLSTPTDLSGKQYLVQQSCDGTAASYPAWTAET